jgi:hypothetical protein
MTTRPLQIVFLYGSQTGNAEVISKGPALTASPPLLPSPHTAQGLHADALALGYSAAVACLNEYATGKNSNSKPL